MIYSWFFLISFFLFAADVFGEAYCIRQGRLEDLVGTSEKGVSTPDGLLMSPGIYAFNGPSYDCTEEGLYRFYTVGSVTEQRLVFGGDVDGLMESLSWLVCHGFKDDTLDFSTALGVVKKRKLQMTCGSIVNFTVALLSLLGVPCRFVLLLTLAPWNHYNNGHSILEVFQNGRWVAWDVDFRNRFERDGERLSAWEFREAVVDGSYDLIKFSQSPLLAAGNLSWKGYDYGFHYERNFLFEDNLRMQYKKCAQIILIRKNGDFYFTCDPVFKNRIKSYDKSFAFLEEQEFIEEFYPSKISQHISEAFHETEIIVN